MITNSERALNETPEQKNQDKTYIFLNSIYKELKNISVELHELNKNIKSGGKK